MLTASVSLILVFALLGFVWMKLIAKRKVLKGDNVNRFLDEFLQFYSQAERGNGLTRGLETSLAKQTYVQTLLDKKLTPTILAGLFRLAILSGNSGDGKTALIQMIEREAEAHGAKVTRIAGVGSKFSFNGREFETLYDGSVDVEGENGTNMEMLSRFFRTLEGDEEPSNHGPCLIVAMNEGKLRDFLGRSASHGWLSRTLLNHLLKDIPLASAYVIVNLNLRSVVDASSTISESLFDKILDRFVSNEFWSECETCVVKLRCPVKFNVDSLRIFHTDGLSERDRIETERRNNASKAIRRRLKSVFQVLHFRKRLHVTVRDLRSALAYTLFGKKNCNEIKAEIEAGSYLFVERYYYNAIFAANEKDRVLRLLSEFDVGKTATPQIDSLLSFTRPKSPEFRGMFLNLGNARVAHLGRTQIDENDLAELFDKKPRSPEERTEEAFRLARNYVASVRRKLFFEGSRSRYLGKETEEQTVIWADLLPYDNLQEFIDFVNRGCDPEGKLKTRIVEGISRSEGIHDKQRSKENVCIRTRQEQNAKIKAFFAYPATDFLIELPAGNSQAAFVEYLPTSIQFRHHDTVLEVSLDLYEMLMRIRDGYVATAGEMRAFFLNLLMFKKQLMALPAKELLLTETDYQVYKLTRTPQNGVVLSNL